MSAQGSTLLSRFEQARAECIRLAEETNRFLVESGRRTVSVVQADRLRFALMGQYNAGKSTLVNALLGQKVAQTGDAPTTRRAHAYDFRSFHILDLPGSDARLEEEQEAERALQDVHFIVYVVSSQTGLDYESFWLDLEKLVTGGHLFLLVVNDKQQTRADTANGQRFRDEVLGSFRRKARERLDVTDWDGKLFWVNVDGAFRARQAEPRKRLLEEASGINPFEGRLVELLSDNDTFLRAVPRLADLLHALEETERALDQQLASDESRWLSAARQRCDTVQEKLTAAANEIASEHFPHLQEALTSLLTRSIGEENQQAVAAEATSLLQEMFRAVVEGFEGRCQGEMQMLAARLGGPATPGKVVRDDELRLNLGSLPHVSLPAGFDWAGMLRNLANITSTVTKLVQGLTAEAGTALVNEGVKEAAQTVVRGGGTQVAQGLAKQTAGGAARTTGVLGKVLGPALLVLQAGWEVYRGWEKAGEEKRQKEVALREVQGIAARTTTQVRELFLGRATRGIGDALSPVLRQLNDELRARSRQATDLERRLARAGELRNQLQRVISELNARSQE